MEHQSNIAITIGQRLRVRRMQLRYSQEFTSEKADLHPTYIGQVERGGKTLQLVALKEFVLPWIYLWNSFFSILWISNPKTNPAQKCYDLIVSQPIQGQKLLYTITENIIKYKKNKLYRILSMLSYSFCKKAFVLGTLCN